MSYTNGLDKPTDYFNTVTWTGTDDSTTAVTGVGFQPDWVWVKNRNVADDHMLFDAVRGVTKRLFSNSSGAEGTDAETLTSFDSDGFSTGNNRATGGSAGNGMVAWNWLASNTTASNTDGSITSTVSANTTSGFSIVSYTGNGSAGATVGHGLGTIPAMVIQKRRTGSTASWVTWHQSIHSTSGNSGAVFLNLTNANSTGNSDTIAGVSSTLITTAGTGAVNPSGDTCIMYCFAEKKGFSKFGSYTGNGSTDGTFVYTGFKPAFVLYKQSSSAGNQWEMRDNLRDVTFNPTDKALAPNLSSAEFTTDPIDLLSNGFKFRGGNGQDNGSGSTYIYMCFAENPFTTSTGIPCTAR